MSGMAKKSARGFLFFCSVVLLLSLPLTSFALTTSFDNINFKPATDASGYFSIYGSQTLAPRTFFTGFYLDYANTVIKFNLTGNRHQDLLKQLFVMDIFGSVGITNWWQIGMNIPIVLFDQYKDPTTRIESYRHSLGDIRLETKFRLLDPELYKIGIALLPFVTIPTRLGDSYVSNQSFAGGGLLAVDYAPVDFFSLSANVGYLARAHYTDAFGANINDQIIFGIGLSARPVKKLSAIVELTGMTPAGNGFAKDLKSPVEIRGGVSISLPYNLLLKAGAGTGVTDGLGDPAYRIFGGLSYNYGAKPVKAEVAESAISPAPVEYPTSIKEPMIAPSKVLVQTPQIIPETEPLKEQKIEVTSDVTTILSLRVHFLEGSYSITERDHEVLNRVADILKEYPKIQLSVDGYSCSKGSKYRNLILSTIRSIRVENYLVGQGISPERLTHTAFGPANPIGKNSTSSGRAQNRRVEFSVVGS